MKRALLCLALALCVSPGFAKNQNGHDLLTRCEPVAEGRQGLSEVQETDAVFCLGYVRGIADGLQVAKQLGLRASVCLPKRITSGELVGAAVKYLKQNNHELDRHAAVLTVAAFQKSYPCK